MKDPIYIHNDTAILNYSTFYPKSNEAFLASSVFYQIMDKFLNDFKVQDSDAYDWLCNHQAHDVVIVKMQKFLRTLYVLEIEEMESRLLADRERLIYVIEAFYTYYRKLQRLATIKISESSSGYVVNIMDADTRFNNMMRYMYRNILEKVQGYRSNVYRQLDAGTDAAMVLCDVNWQVPEGYEGLSEIPFACQILLKPPLLLHPKANKRYGSFDLVDDNVIKGQTLDYHQYYCYPAKVGELLIFVYVNFDFAFSGLANANLFQLATRKEVAENKVDGILVFGYPDGTETCTYTYDQEADLWVGKVPYMEMIEYFGYMKKMVLTMHNAIMMSKGRLPVHGSMINLRFRGNRSLGVCFIGDSGAGKSEVIEAMDLLKHPDLLSMDIIFDDMGSFLIENGQVLAQGSEIGAFIRLDDLDKGSPYKSMDRAIFMNPDSTNARIVVPVTAYHVITKKHPIDFLFYANNYENKVGYRLAKQANDIKDVFVEGKRMAMATTHEKGLSTTYFANPFGPMQDQATCDGLLERFFKVLTESGVPVGEVYTGLGVVETSSEHLKATAKLLLELFEHHLNQKV